MANQVNFHGASKISNEGYKNTLSLRLFRSLAEAWAVSGEGRPPGTFGLRGIRHDVWGGA